MQLNDSLMLHIIITIDYEIFGDGSGNVLEHIVYPTERILQLCNTYEVPITIMFEINEYLKFIEYDDNLREDLGYSPAEIIKEQVIKALAMGHDVQLHIHPQWIDATYENMEWIIPNPLRSITDLKDEEIDEAIRKGKNELENLVRSSDFDYVCCAMRLSNLPWEEAPAEVILPMKKNGIKVHTLSAANNEKNNEKGYWSLDSENEVFEIPIHSIDRSVFFLFLKFHRLKTALYRRQFSKPNVYTKNILNGKSQYRNFFSFLTRKYSFKWDLCKQSAAEMLRFLDLGMKRYDHQKYQVPLVMISHSKDFFNDKNLENFFSTVKDRHLMMGDVRFSTLQEFVMNELTTYR